MVQMIFIWHKNRGPLVDPTNNGKKGIKYGDPQDHNRHEQGNQGSALSGTHYSQTGQYKSQEIRSSVPHEGAGGMEIIG